LILPNNSINNTILKMLKKVIKKRLFVYLFFMVLISIFGFFVYRLFNAGQQSAPLVQKNEKAVQTKENIVEYQPQTIQLTVSSETISCQGTGIAKCLLIKKMGQNVWTALYEDIIGFNHLNGFEYELEVRREIIKDSLTGDSSHQLVLVRQISMIKMASLKLPIQL